MFLKFPEIKEIKFLIYSILAGGEVFLHKLTKMF